MRIMITGGGTAGHTSPAVAIIEELQRRDPRLMVQWIGRKGGREENLCPRLSIPFRSVPVAPWPRSKGLRMGWAAFRVALGFARSMLYIQRFRPQAVIGVGSYVSIPLLLAAQRRGAPTFLHEQNKRLGMANQLAAKRATALFLSYPETLGDYPEERAIVSGNPVRAAFLKPPSQADARRRFGLQHDIPVLLVTGGSQGAQKINEAVHGLLPELGRNECQILWTTGTAFAAKARTLAAECPVQVQVFPYIEDMVHAMAAADLIVSRAGASSTAEIAAIGKPSILVPYPHATENHQEINARAFESAEAGEVILDADLSSERLLDSLRRLLPDPQVRERMGRAALTLARPEAAEIIADKVLEIIFDETGTAGNEAEDQ